MKRAGNLYDRICEPENLRLAFIKSIRSKRCKSDVIAYTANLGENLGLLREQLLAEQVDVGHYHFFTVHDPKERVICAASFPERVLHRAIAQAGRGRFGGRSCPGLSPAHTGAHPSRRAVCGRDNCA